MKYFFSEFTYLVLRHGSDLQNEVIFLIQKSLFSDPEIEYFSEFNFLILRHGSNLQNEVIFFNPEISIFRPRNRIFFRIYFF